MTEDELDALKLNVRVGAIECALVSLFQSLGRRIELHESLRECVSTLRAPSSALTIPGASPEYSMLFSGEIADALNYLADKLQTELDEPHEPSKAKG